WGSPSSRMRRAGWSVSRRAQSNRRPARRPRTAFGPSGRRAARPPSIRGCARGEKMLVAVIGSSAGKTRDEIMAIYPRHKAFLEQFLTRGEVVGVGPFTDAGGGNMALFRSRAAAEAFATLDPFLLEGVVREYQIKEWGDTMLS